MIWNKKQNQEKIKQLEQVFMAKKGTPEYEEAVKLEKEIYRFEKIRFFSFKRLFHNIIFKIKKYNRPMIHWTKAVELAKKGKPVPEELIDYDDENIDYSDIPEFDEEDVKKGKLIKIK